MNFALVVGDSIALVPLLHLFLQRLRNINTSLNAVVNFVQCFGLLILLFSIIISLVYLPDMTVEYIDLTSYILFVIELIVLNIYKGIVNDN